MQFDIRIGSIYAIYRKKENISFEFDCKKRSHDGFIFVINGEGYFENSRCKEVLRKNSIVLLSEASTYFVKALTDDFEYITTAMRITPTNWLSSLGIGDVIHLENKSYTANLIYQMYDTWEKRASLFTMRTRVVTEQILINLYEENSLSVSSKNEIRLSPALDYIGQNYDKNISVKQLSALCNLSVSHFRRLFKEVLGVSPMQYRENIRIYWAKQFLKSDFFTVSEIAAKLGYYDIYHFSKEFKKATNKSPLTYKKEKK